jgi:hypothetical protein
MRSARRASSLVLVFGLLLLPVLGLAGEQAQHRDHPDLLTRLSGLHTVGIVTPELKVYELTASNQPVFRQDWTEQGREAVTEGLEALLQARGVATKRFEPGTSESKEELREVRLLYDSVVAAVYQATFANQFRPKVERFEYSVGDLSQLLDAQQVDALVFTFGSGTISSGGRKAVQVVSALFAGVTSSGLDRLLVGVVDRRGDLLWFGTFESTGSDLRDHASAAKFVRTLGSGLPAVAR